MIQIENINVSYQQTLALDNITLNLDGPSITGIIGPNGAGKSTLIKIIAGIEQPDQGQIVRNKNIQLGYLAQNTGLESENTVWEEMLLAFPCSRIKSTDS